MGRAALALAVPCVLAACQHSVKTPFPAGLEPFEDNPVPEETAPYDEVLNVSSTDNDYIRVYARGYVLVSPAAYWQAAQVPLPYVASCSTTTQSLTPENDPSYEFSLLVHYTYDDVLTVEWDDQWRAGIVQGDDAAPTLVMAKHQKTDGSSFITRSEGTIEALATDDPNVTELSFVEHLDATGASTDRVITGIKHNYAALTAVAHGQPIPACP